MSSILDNLNTEQEKAVKSIEGPNIVVAGAGSGKTKVLTQRIAYMVKKGIPPYTILALTFTNKAAKEMRERIAAILGKDTANQLWMGTFHSIFARILRFEAEALGYSSNYTIYDTEDSKNLIKRIIKQKNLDKDTYKPNKVYARISKAKNNLITPNAYINNDKIMKMDMNAGRPEIGNLYTTYAKCCYRSDAMDFDDLLINTNILFRDFKDILAKYQNKFNYVLIDEYQDTNYSQYLIVNKLAEKHKNICVVGDDAQSIYSFRGARIQNILDFKTDYPDYKQYKLEQNYRSTKNILNAANSIIDKNINQIKKKIWSDNETGDKVTVNKAITDSEEGYMVAGSVVDNVYNHKIKYSDIAVLYRTNAQSRILEEAFRKRDIPYKVYGGLSFYQRKEIKDVIAYLRLVINRHDDEALLRIINYPRRGIGNTTITKLVDLAAKEDKSVWQIIENKGKYNLNINAGTSSKLSKFHNLIHEISKDYKEIDAYELANNVVRKTGILNEFKDDKSPEAISRFENITELLNGIRDFCENILEEQGDNLVTIDRFLENVALLTDQDTDKENKNKVTLMTIHSAKGLEFDTVYIVGLEEELFPSMMSMGSPKDIEEERRLFYVAVTRAKRKAYISFTTSRYKWGSTHFPKPSRFLEELDTSYVDMPEELLEIEEEVPEERPAQNFSFGKKQEKPKQLYRRQKIVKRPPSPVPENFKPDDPEKLKNGMAVVHAKFGKGKILTIEGEKPNKKATVFFTNSGEKKLLLKYAKLQIDKN